MFEVGLETQNEASYV